MQIPSRMLTRLNLATRSLHPEADALWVDIFTAEVTAERYGDALIAVYGFEAPIEAAVALTPGVNAVLQLRPRARTGFIVQDLLTLGFTASRIARLPQCCQIAPFPDVADALGWLYVVERATLLHDMVCRHIRPQLAGLHAFSYLSAYDGVASLRWQELGRALDSVATTAALEGQMIAAAQDAFATQRHWMASESQVAAGA